MRESVQSTCSGVFSRQMSENPFLMFSSGFRPTTARSIRKSHDSKRDDDAGELRISVSMYTVFAV